MSKGKSHIFCRSGGSHGDRNFVAIPDSLVHWTFHELETNVAYVSSRFGEVRSDIQLANINTLAFNKALEEAKPGDTVLIPDKQSYSLIGGVLARDKHGITIDFAGSLHFVPDISTWPFGTYPDNYLQYDDKYNPCIEIYNSTNVTLTSSSLTRAKVTVDYNANSVHLVDWKRYSGGIINGNGKVWWDAQIAGTLPHHRPRLIHIAESANVLVEYLTLLNSPYWTLTVEAADSEVRYVNVLVDRRYESVLSVRTHSLAIEKPLEGANLVTVALDFLPDWLFRKFHQPQDLNTDGIDPMGQNIWIHDCIVSNGDDSVAVKPMHGGRPPSRLEDCTRNITIENMVLTGFGASVGSVTANLYHRCIDNVTFRNISMPGTGKGENCIHAIPVAES